MNFVSGELVMAETIKDAAFLNAFARRDHARDRILEINNKLNELMALRVKLAQDYEKADAFLDTWYEMAGLPNPKYVERKESKPAPAVIEEREKRPQNPNRRDVTLKAVEYIREAGRPLSRAEIWERLQNDNVVIHGKNPEMVLSTMLWRTKDLIRRLRGGGYWPVGDPPPPGHSADIEDLIG
jgi:hypothetical protein